MVRADLPSGTVTFLFTDIEGSTKLLHELGAQGFDAALVEHRRVLRGVFARHGGVEVDTQGDAFFCAFPDAQAAVQAALEGQRELATGPVRVRVGIHTGTPHVGAEGYIGPDVHKGARIGAAGHGGQVLLSKQTRDLIELEVTDLGEHRLKDFAEPVWIYQLGDNRFPPLKTISNTNLPRPTSSFIGREQERDEVVALLANGARLVTLTGPGGTGKTRLSIEAAAELVPEFTNGVFWVGLATLRDPALVTATIAQTIGAQDGLAEHIGERAMLLLVDNFEQVVAAAPQLSSVLKVCPNLRVLVTSRELLRIDGEVDYPVPPLAHQEAIELFCTRSRLESNETIAELCRRLDNLPLAVELAAARTSVLTPVHILKRLSQRLDLLKGGRDAEARQATLRATIEWSHDLLNDEERQLFARLGVFRGGCTLEAAEEVAGAELDTLQSLVDKSLVRHTNDRFWMLETIREFALERLEGANNRDETEQRHTEYFSALAEEAYPELRGDPKAWLDTLQSEHDNLRSTLDRLQRSDATEEALGLAGALYRFWYMTGHLAEGTARLETLLAIDDSPSAARARALTGAAVMASTVGHPGLASERAQEALALNRSLGDTWGATYCTFLLGMVATELSDWTTARERFEESLNGFRTEGDEHYVLLAMDGLAWAHGELGDSARRRAMHEEILAEARSRSNTGVAALQLNQLAKFAFDEGKPAEAFSMLQEAIELNRDLNRPEGIAENLSGVADFLAELGESEWAARALALSERLRVEVGSEIAWLVELNKKTRSLLRKQLDAGSFAAAWDEGRRMTIDDVFALTQAGDRMRDANLS